MSDAKIICPKCEKDMTPRPGAVLVCGEEICAFWRCYASGSEDHEPPKVLPTLGQS